MERIPTTGSLSANEYEIITAEGGNGFLSWGRDLQRHRRVEALEGIIIDITDRKAIESTLKYTSEHDNTGLTTELPRRISQEPRQETAD